MSIDLTGRQAAVLGGDGREIEIARRLVAAGARVRLCGQKQEDAAGAGADWCPSLPEAVAGAEIIICPIPLPAADGAIYAPAHPEPLVVDAESLAGAAPGAILITGKAGPKMREAARAHRLELVEYEHDEELMLLRAPTIAEGAIGVAIRETEVTLHANPLLVVGFGKIGPTLARMLLGLGGRVTVAARNPVQRARAWSMGCAVVHTDELAEAASAAVVIFNTAPARLFTRELLARIHSRPVLIDLSAPPGGVDFDAARELGIKAIWARGLGGRAPRTAGESQWMGIRRILAAKRGW